MLSRQDTTVLCDESAARINKLFHLIIIRKLPYNGAGTAGSRAPRRLALTVLYSTSPWAEDP